MKKLSLLGCGLCVLLLLTYTAFAQMTDLYIVGGAGDDFTPPPGYLLATLAQVKSTSFTSLYNVYGLRDAGERMSPSWCSVLSVADGYLVMGQLSNPSYLGPYGTSRQPQTENVLTSPVWFGLIAGGSLQPRFIGPLTTDDLNALYTIPFSSTRLACNRRSYFGIYIRAEYVVAGYGRDYPNPPAGGQLARLSDITSGSFISSYNGAGLDYLPHSLNGGCCVLNVLEGALRIEDSFFSPYANPTLAMCTSGLNQRVWFGTGPWGRYARQYIGQLNSSVIFALKATTDMYPASCSNSAPNSFAIYKRPYHTPDPTTVPVSECYKVELRVAYYDPARGIAPCLADRWRYIIHINQTYENIDMEDFHTCGWDTKITDLILRPYTSDALAARTNGATDCDCHDWGKIPYNHTKEMSVVCHKTMSTFGWCRILMSIDTPVTCPPYPKK